MKKWLVSACYLACVDVFGIEYSIGGRAEAFSKAGFNNGAYNPSSYQYPTDSYASMLGALELDVKDKSGLSASLGGALNALVYDSTLHQGGESLGNGYIGAWFGYYGDEAMRARQYIMHNAYVAYQGEYVGIKLGRYESDGLDWFSAWNQGGELYIQNDFLKLWGFYSDSRALVYSNWFWDYSRFGVAGSSVYAGGLDMRHDGMELSVYTYGSPHRFVAPGVKLTWQQELTRNVSNKLIIIGLFPINERNPKGHNGEIIPLDTLFNQKIDTYTQTLFIREEVGFYEYFAGAMLYKNWGNANAWIGSYGDPLNGFDIWSGSAYDKSGALSDIIGRDALSIFGYIGGVHGDFSWQILGRYTQSPRSDEKSLALALTQVLYGDLSLRVKLEYFGDTTKAGYAIGNDVSKLSHHQSNDRSHAMAWLSQQF